MKYINLPAPRQGESRQLPFYFAVEEYVAKHFTDDDYFFIWQVEPTAMLGRNQLLENEVNEQYCREHGVHIYRRKSGGGTVYADRGCLQFSYITKEGNVNALFNDYIDLVVKAINRLGVAVSSSGRNDILVEGKKVAGAAFYRYGNRSVLHNTLLYSTDLDQLASCLKPSKKLESKGVKSNRQRVANLGDYTRLTLPQFVEQLRQLVCGDSQITLNQVHMQGVAQLEKPLASHEFVYDNSPSYTVKRSLILKDVGEIEARVQVKAGKIQYINLVGDYFLLGDLDRDLLARLQGVDYDREAVTQALDGVDTGKVIRNLTVMQFLRLLFGRPPHLPKPEWLKIDLTSTTTTRHTSDAVAGNHLNTICTSGLCPNKAECWKAGTATLMIGGNVCTRNCRFCNTPSGRPQPLDPNEPLNVAKAVAQLQLKHAVITSVDRDDLPDLGARHWSLTVKAIKELNPHTTVEVLIPDFQGRLDLVDMVLAEQPYIVGHNIETVRRLTPAVRSVAQYDQSLDVLRHIAERGFTAKSGLMLGLGETEQEVEQTMDDLLAAGCKILTIGQYLQPTLRHIAVKAYIKPSKFAQYKQLGEDKGFEQVVSDPFVRSSYHAEQYKTLQRQE